MLKLEIFINFIKFFLNEDDQNNDKQNEKNLTKINYNHKRKKLIIYLL
jgi:hypothetical protein